MIVFSQKPRDQDTFAFDIKKSCFLLVSCWSKASCTSFRAELLIKLLKKLLINNHFYLRNLRSAKLCISSIVRTKFNLTNPSSWLDMYRLVCAVVELHQIFSSIIAIYDPHTVCQHQPIFDRQRASRIDSTISPRRDKGFDPTFYEFDCSRLYRNCLCTSNISTCRLRTLLFWQKSTIVATNQDFFHFFS